MRRAAFHVVVIGLVWMIQASPARAEPGWATWVVNDATSATADRGDGRTALLTGHPIAPEAANSFASSDPPVPGEPSGGNPHVLGVFTGPLPAPDIVASGSLLATLDFGNYPIDDETTVGFSDQQDNRTYRLEFLDASLIPLSMTAIEVSNYNFTLTTTTFVADYDLLFDGATGLLTVNRVHDANPPGAVSYRHSGFTMFKNLPPATRSIRLLDATTLEFNREGVKFYLGDTPVPEPGLAMLQFAAVASVALLRSVRLRARA